MLVSEKTLRSLPVDHDLLINWFHINLLEIQSIHPQLKVAGFTTNTTPSSQIVTDSSFIPDGIFAIRDTESSKALLFFLEVDMGTETTASPSRSPNDFRQKVHNYQNLFRIEKYKQCRKLSRSSFNGFRLLILSNIHARHATLCSLVQEMPPSNFI